MKHIIVLVLLAVAAVTAAPDGMQRIVGGAQTTIGTYPMVASLLFGTSAFRHTCGGTILNNRSILTAAQCPIGTATVNWRIRMGSTSSTSGGILRIISRYIVHASYNRNTRANDIAIMRLSATLTYTNRIHPATIAGAGYGVAANQAVWAIGWGSTTAAGSASVVNLRRVQISVINQATCRTNYAAVGRTVTANMICAGHFAGGRGQCRGDEGGPLLHNNVLVGIYSFSTGCVVARHPAVNTRVSQYATWIRINA